MHRTGDERQAPRWASLRRSFAGLCLCILGGIAALVCLTIWPEPLFAYGVEASGIELHSDRPIPAEARDVLKDVERRLAQSQLPPAGPYHVYICNDAWKLAFFGHTLSTSFGGISDVYLTRNVFIRASDLGRNSIVAPASWRFPLEDRPLSYFIAHEITHVQQVHALGRFAYFHTPSWLLEGYADYIGKGEQWDIDRSVKALREGAPEMDPRNGVYNRYHLAVGLLLKQRSFLNLAADPPDPEKALRETLFSPGG